MAVATVNVSETNGTVAGQATTDGIGSMNLGSADVPNLVPATYKIVRGTQSYAKWFRLHVAAMNDAVGISNIQVWKASGTYVTGELIGSNLTVPTTGWVIATYGKSTTGGGSVDVSPMPYNGTGAGIFGGNVYSSGAIQPPTSDPGAENLTIGGAAGGSLAAPGYSNYLVMGCSTTVGTPLGAVHTKTFTWQYDEI